jgi:hypothetical protein
MLCRVSQMILMILFELRSQIASVTSYEFRAGLLIAARF